jgi:hypothetical protein
MEWVVVTGVPVLCLLAGSGYWRWTRRRADTTWRRFGGVAGGIGSVCIGIAWTGWLLHSVGLQYDIQTATGPTPLQRLGLLGPWILVAVIGAVLSIAGIGIALSLEAYAALSNSQVNS